MNPKKILMLALLSGVVTTVVFYLFIDQASSSSPVKENAMVTIVAAGEDIKANQKITEGLLKVEEVAKDKVHPQMVTDKRDVIGKLTVTEIKAGEPMMTHRVQSDKEVEDTVSLKVSQGKRAISITVDYVASVSNLIEPEDYVDVFLTTGEESKMQTEVIKEKVRVLAVGKRMIEKKEDAPDEEYHAVTLELNPEDSLQVINASARGRLQLALYSKQASSGDDKKDRGTKAEPSATLSPIPVRSVIRSGPGLDENVITVVDKGTVLQDLGKESADDDGRVWLYVETPDHQKGWISSRIIKYASE